MQQAILDNINNPHQLELFYRENPALFTTAFDSVYVDVKGNTIADCWFERLNYKKEESYAVNKREMLLVVLAAIIAGFVAKLPAIFHLNEENFFEKNLSFIVFPFLIAYFSWKQQLTFKRMLFPVMVVLLSVIYINLLPVVEKSDVLFLATIHLPIVLWIALGFTFTGNDYKNPSLRINYLRFNGDFLVMTAVIMASCMIFTGITMGLFKMINIDIQEVYFQYIAVWGAASIPLVATYLLQHNPSMVNKVSPTIAKIFTPLVLVLLLTYLIAVAYTGKDPYNDREFLLIFNVLLIAVMAIIFFSIAEAAQHTKKDFQLIMLLMLSVLTIIVNVVALSAIGFRIMQWGFSPNRLAVLGSNLLIFVNLMRVSFQLFKSIRGNQEIERIEKSIVSYLPVYGAWAAFVAFLFPLIFGIHR
jgi:hypothetical protein